MTNSPQKLSLSLYVVNSKTSQQSQVDEILWGQNGSLENHHSRR